MNKKMMAALLAAVMLMGACAGALAQSLTTPVPMEYGVNPTKITVQGRAQVTADPDMVTVMVNASATAGTVGAAQEQVAAVVEKATAKLVELGVLESDIVTSSYCCYPQYNYDTNTVTGYEASHGLSITCRDVDMLDSVLGAMTDSGFSQIHNVSYDVSMRSELYQQALDLAIARAEQKAVRMAQASGLMITGIDSLSENGGYNEGWTANVYMDGAMLRSASGATGIRSGSVSVEAAVTVVYEAAGQ